MEEKQADNKIHTYKIKMDQIDEEIYVKNKKLKSLDNLEESLTKIDQKINECAQIINRSIKGKKTNLQMNDISAKSRINLKKSLMDMDEERIKLRKEINSLHDNKDILIKEMKEEYKNIDNKDILTNEMKEEYKNIDNKDNNANKEN